MSNYLRDVLGAGNSSSAQPQGLVADSGPDIPGGEGANKGFWRKQLKDRLMRFAKMYGSVLFDVEIENIGRVAGHGQIIDAVAPNIALIRIKNHPILGDMDLPVPSTQFEVVDAVIPDADYKRISRNNPNLKQKKPKLKDSMSGDEVLSTIRSAVAKDLKEKGRFPVIRSAKDLEEVVSAQYKSLFPQIKEENPELLKVFGNMEIPNEDLFWDYIKANYATDLMTMYVSPDQIPPLNKLVNQLYAEKFLGVKKDGLISFYRNNIRSKPNESEAAAGYASLDKYMAFDYNVAMGKNDGGEFVGRYEVKAKPDEVTGLLGYSRIEDEIGVVISPEVTSIPGRVTKLGDVEIPNPENAPWFDLENLDFNRGTGGSPFRHLTPLGQFDYYALDSNPFGDGKGWSAFYAANGLETGAIPNKYDELYGEGAWERDWSEEKPQAAMYNAMFKEFTDEDGNKKWGLKGESIHNLAFGTEKYFNDPKAGDEFDRAIKVLSVMQELMGKPFFVNRGHDPNDPRLKDVEKQDVLRPASIEDLGIDFQTATMDASGTRLPTPGAFTGKFQDIMAGAQSWKEVQDRLAGQTITYFDFETTGISDYDGDGIKNDPLQLGAVQVKDGKIIKRFNLYVNPESKLSYWSATKLKRDVVDENGNKVLDEKGNPTYTQLTPEWIKEQASPDDAIRQFVEFIGPDALVGGQNVPFDMEILKRMADSAGIELDISGTIDSKDLASLLPKYDPEKGIDGPKQLEDEKTGKMRPSSSLGPVANFLGFEPANWHSADGDAEDSYNLVSKIIDRAAKEDNRDLRLLDFDLQEKQYKERMDEFKKVVSKDNPITQRQLDALEEFSKSDSEEIASSAKKALAEAKTRGEAAQLLEVINTLNDKKEAVKEQIELSEPENVIPEYRFRNDETGWEYSDDHIVGSNPNNAPTDEELDAIKTYTGDGYNEINSILRGQGMDSNSSFSEEEILASIENLTNLIDRNPPLGTKALVYRGVNDYAGFKWQNLEVGDEILDTGFISVSPAGPTARGFGLVNLEIELSEDTKVIDVSRTVEDTRVAVSEQELILQRGTKFEVVAKTENGLRLRVIGVEDSEVVESKPETSEERSTGLFNEYDSERADQITAEDTPLTDLGWEPWEEITIYRGVPDDVDSINPGDWVTTLPQLAKDYAGANGKVISTKVKASELLADPSVGVGAYTEEMVWRPKAKPEKTSEPRSEIASIDMSGTRLSSEVKEELNSLISSFNIANTEAKSQAYREIAAELGRPVSLPWDKDRTPEGRETYDYIDSAERFKKATAETDEEKELLRIKNLFEEKVANNKDLQEAREALYSNKIYKDVVDALSSEINDFDEDNIDFGLMDVGRNLSRPRPRLSDDEIEEFLIESPDYADEKVNELTYDVTVDIDQSVEITNKDLKEFSETAAVSIILPSRALEEVLNEGRMKTVHETKYSQAGNSSEEYRALRVAYESLAFGYGGDSPMEERPVYGLLRSTTLPMPEDALMIYGGGKPAQIFLKPEVKDRTTISDRDSLNFFESTTSLTDPKFEASHLTRMAAVYREATGDNFFETENFAKFGSIEAQIHGGVKLEDIGKVVLYETPSEELRELLTSKGIIWEVSRNKPYSKPRTFGGGIF